MINWPAYSKASTLLFLKERVNSASIAPIFVLEVSQWDDDRNTILQAIDEAFEDIPLIVRSSSAREDSMDESFAGAFLTIKGVLKVDIEDAINQVICSYGVPNKKDEVLIQPMLCDVVRSGVAFTHNPNTGAPYRTISWTEGSDTSNVTAGQHSNAIVHAESSPVILDEWAISVIRLLNDLVLLFDQIPLDIEFAFTNNFASSEKTEKLWLLQVRPLIVAPTLETSCDQNTKLNLLSNKMKEGMKRQPFLLGETTLYGVMPDWNPAEIIGLCPRPLALSLYRELVTDSIWAYQRNNYGYRNLRSFPLMQHFLGIPYIDVRVSFNSFVPSDLDDTLSEKLVNYYLNCLKLQPNLHDKIEFEIISSCYTFDFDHVKKELASNGFTSSEIQNFETSLKKLTNNILNPRNGLWREDVRKIDILNNRRKQIIDSELDKFGKIYWLIEDAKRYGTLPFAGLARAGFIAVQYLRSLVGINLLSEEEYGSFLSSVETIGKRITLDLSVLEEPVFLDKYGHLRPGTYDITSPRYDEASELYFDWNNRPETVHGGGDFVLDKARLDLISRRLFKAGLSINSSDLFDFCKYAIEWRELAKFYFTQNLSDALKIISEYGDDVSLSKEELSFSEISVFQEAHLSAIEVRPSIVRSIQDGKELHESAKKISLPPLIRHPDEAWTYYMEEASPNFITNKVITASICSYHDREKLNGAIVAIPHADPGFDWLFTFNISGLITAWGGINSHMAIRAGELGIPAVLGCGERLFQMWSEARVLRVDCSSKLVEVVA